MVAYIPPKQAGKYKAVASGAITNGKPVIVNSTGTVSQVSGSATSAGSEQVFYSATIGELHIGTTFDSNSNRVVLVYKDDTNSHYGTARVGTIDSSDNSVSFGTAVVFNSTSSSYNAPIFDSSDNKVVIAIRDSSSGGTAVVGTVDPSDNSISFGSVAQFETGNADFTAATYDSNADRTVIAYSDSGNSSHGTAIVGTVSGTSISYGSAAVFESAEVANVAVTFDSSNNKVVIVYRDVGNSNYGTAIVGTVSGTSISFGTAVVFSSATTTGIRCTFDSNSNKVFISFDEHSGNTIKGIVGTVSGTGISFGTAVQIEPALATGNYTATGFDSSTNKVIVVYGDSGDSGKGKVSVGTISGTSVSFETPVQFNAGSTAIGYNSTGVAFDSNVNRFLLAYNDSGNSQYGTTVVIQTSATNLSASTSEGFIGIASGGTYADTAEATIDVVGTVNKDQSGLTAGQTYYVQTDGTLGTTADDPSVVAGTAISATEIIVKG